MFIENLDGQWFELFPSQYLSLCLSVFFFSCWEMSACRSRGFSLYDKCCVVFVYLFCDGLWRWQWHSVWFRSSTGPQVEAGTRTSPPRVCLCMRSGLKPLPLSPHWPISSSRNWIRGLFDEITHLYWHLIHRFLWRRGKSAFWHPKWLINHGTDWRQCLSVLRQGLLLFLSKTEKTLQ